MSLTSDGSFRSAGASFGRCWPSWPFWRSGCWWNSPQQCSFSIWAV